MKDEKKKSAFAEAFLTRQYSFDDDYAPDEFDPEFFSGEVPQEMFTDKFWEKGKFRDSLKHHHFILSPPPLPIPYGMAESKLRKHVWVRKKWKEHQIELSFSIRSNEIYSECNFKGAKHIVLYPFTFIFALICALWVYFIVRNHPGSLIIPFLFILYTVYAVYATKTRKPYMIFNRMRREIYVYTHKHLIVKKFDETRFVVDATAPTATLKMLTEMHPKSCLLPTYINIYGARGVDSATPYWEYIRLYMGTEEEYQYLAALERELPVGRPIFPWNTNSFIASLSPANRWPKEIEMLLLPENKDMPLPEGLEYDKWLPWKMPALGYDNSEWLNERKRRLAEEQQDDC